MKSVSIEVIGKDYKSENMLVDTVEPCDGFTIVKNGYGEIVTVHDRYMGGVIVDCFNHPESDCIFFVAECKGVYFCVYPDYDSYVLFEFPFR